MKLKEILLLITLLMTAGAYAQKNSIIRLEQGNDLKYDKMLGISTYRVVGNVIFEHQGAFLYCDSAIMSRINHYRGYFMIFLARQTIQGH